jgi:ABC-type uncharacterized transport system permease subunit
MEMDVEDNEEMLVSPYVTQRKWIITITVIQVSLLVLFFALLITIWVVVSKIQHETAPFVAENVNTFQSQVAQVTKDLKEIAKDIQIIAQFIGKLNGEKYS